MADARAGHRAPTRRFAREGYARNAIVYRAVRIIAESIGSLCFVLYDGVTERDNASVARSSAAAQSAPGRRVFPRRCRFAPSVRRQRMEADVAFATRYGFSGNQTGDGLVLAADIDRVEALSSDRAAVWERVGNAAFLTISEKRLATGYGAVNGGDVFAP